MSKAGKAAALRDGLQHVSQSLRDRVTPLAGWSRRQYSMPAPPAVKQAVLSRYGVPEGTWIETGTFQGDTTAFLARRARRVYSIEPSPELAGRAMERFADDEGVTILEGLAEDLLPGVLEGIDAGPLSFWLDGHFSAGATFKGPTDTPIREELAAIERHLDRLQPVAVLIDDVRCFDPANPLYADYPSRGWLVEWAERNKLSWTIEHDIFVAAQQTSAR